MDEPDLPTLAMLVAVATEGSLSAAGRATGVTQQAVSARMRSLEQQLGVSLLHRSARGTQLTETGQLVAGWAAPLLASAESFRRSLDTLRDRGSVVQAAASLTVAEHLFPGWLVALRSLPTGPIEVRLTAANSDRVIDLVNTGLVDVGFIESGQEPVGLSTRVIGHDELVVVAAPTHPWAGRRSIGVGLLATTALVVREPGSGTRSALATALRVAGHPSQALPAAELSSNLAVRTTVAGGLAPGVLSELAVADDLRRGTLVRIKLRDLRIRRPFTAIWRRGRPPATVRRLVDLTAAGVD